MAVDADSLGGAGWGAALDLGEGAQAHEGAVVADELEGGDR
ncbi:hypothetical protein ENSA5_68360 [Enhygromyxa salina]|uniref:Uncharacterized protein n=1 Tax=Enhygromyxa salina TaxID=215803 RepID=A0A2S9XB29_9BACT|nr:hypothetical protein ENSA5_68360 [Enhygromyxa salina]